MSKNKKSQIMTDNDYKDYFNSKCPYTDIFCDTFDCEHCSIEADERSYMDASYYESEV